ncbi:MAG TPA: type IV pilus assembly protein PilM [Candidatus Dormibacteraeota bacterium]|nr:type IV pilus assembly protein PilM [Candidatus Dormibacteraeota bacterium]
MLNSKSFLAVDFGAGTLKLAEFEINEAGGLRLKSYALKPLGAEGSQEATREALILKTLQAAMAEKGVTAKTVNVCAPGFHVFSKFVKLPPVDASKVTQIIEYEAKSNVPFPLEEVVWDYQILGTAPSGELEVLLVAIKADIVEGLFRVTEAAGLRLTIADVSPAALCNSFRYNYGELDDCTMLLDIGAKTSNLLFFEKGKVFSRSINLGANSITQDFSNESKLKFDPAEKLKISEGFVSLGGAYEEPENPHQAAISKIARQFMTRLHIQVNQTMQFYRGQQGGSAPQRLFLSGGASIMPYTAQFFAEKLNVPVEYFNPLRNVQIDPSINLEELAHVAHSLGEVVGLGLRNLAHCPVELNLMPESTLKWQAFNEKKPYFIATVFSLAAGVMAIGFLFDNLAKVKAEQLGKIKPKVDALQVKTDQFGRVYKDLKKSEADLEKTLTYLDERFYWVDVCAELRQLLIRSEETTRIRLRTDTGIWIDKIATAPPEGEAAADASNPVPAAPTRAPEEVEARYRRVQAAAPTPAPTEATPGAPGSIPPLKNTPTEISMMDITFRAVSWNSISVEANKQTAYQVLDELRNSPYFDSTNTVLTTDISADEPPGTFVFGVRATLKKPLKL